MGKKFKHQLLNVYKLASYGSQKDLEEAMGAIETLVKAGVEVDSLVKNVVAQTVSDILETKYKFSEAVIRKYKKLIEYESNIPIEELPRNKAPIDAIAYKVKVNLAIYLANDNQNRSRRRRLSAEVVLGPLLAEI